MRMDRAIRMKNVEQLCLDDPLADAVSAKTETADVAVLLPSIKLRHAERITGEFVMPARDGVYAEFPSDLEPRLAAALRGRGIHRLYSHQLATWNAIRAGQHAVVVTPTASGKTLCYNLPVLQAAMNPNGLTDRELQALSSSGLAASAPEFNPPMFASAPADPSWRQSHPNGLTERELQGLSSSNLAVWQAPNGSANTALASTDQASVAWTTSKETFSARLAKFFHTNGAPAGTQW
jgi:DEAD/DEAH box helicase